MSAGQTNLAGSTALITGATAGIGHAVAARLAAEKVNLILTGRRASKLETIAQDLIKKYGVSVQTVVFDVSKSSDCEKNLAKINLSKLSILINNAGLALGVDTLADGKFSDWDQMIDTNIKGLLYMSRLCLPSMLEQKSGSHLVNLGSVAGRYLYPRGAVYCATKFAVRALSEGLRMDLLGKNIRVTNIEPGMVETEFSLVRNAGDQAKADKTYEGMTPLTGEDIADTIAWCLQRPRHVNIQELVIYPTDQASVGPYVHRQGV